MDFIDDVDLETTLGGGKIDFVAQVADVIHGSVGSRIDLDQIQKASFVNGDTVRAVVAGADFWIFFKAVNSLCQQSRAGCFSGAFGTSEEVCLTDTVGRDCIF